MICWVIWNVFLKILFWFIDYVSIQLHNKYISLCKTKQANMNLKLGSPKGQEDTKNKQNFQQFSFSTYFLWDSSVFWKLAQPCIILCSTCPWSNFRMLLWKIHFSVCFHSCYFLLCILKLYYLLTNFQQICLYICKPFSVHTVSPHCPVEHFITMTQKFKTI